jgi:hypothetical protein
VVNGVDELAPAYPDGVSLTILSRHLKLDKASVSRRWRVARDGGYLKNLEHRRGRHARLVLGEHLPEEVVILPTPEDLAERYSVRPTVGTPPPTVKPRMVPGELADRNTVGGVPGETTPPLSPLPTWQCPEHPTAGTWQARDGQWRCVICKPPLPGEVKAERAGTKEET